uniref:Coproheme decarboxylase n=1 Tax=Anaerolinea thermolimosa TaxID=229919 RepID=A0A7C4KJN1_9CHLR
MPDLFLCHFAGLQYTEHYWSLSPDARQQWAGNLSVELQARLPHHALYQVFPARSETDIFLWSSFLITAPDQAARVFETVARLLNAHRVDLRPTHFYWGFTRLSEYSKAKSSQEIDPLSSEHKKYLIVYPFTKTSDWYRFGRDARQGMMNEHIRIGHQYPQISQLLLYSTGLQDQEFIVAYETDDLPTFSALVSELRTSDARPYTLSDTPIYTAVHHPTQDTLNLFI